MDKYVDAGHISDDGIDAISNAIEAYTATKVREARIDERKKLEQVIAKPKLLPKNAMNLESVKQGINFYHRQMVKRIAELNQEKNGETK